MTSPNFDDDNNLGPSADDLVVDQTPTGGYSAGPTDPTSRLRIAAALLEAAKGTDAGKQASTSGLRPEGIPGEQPALGTSRPPELGAGRGKDRNPQSGPQVIVGEVADDTDSEETNAKADTKDDEWRPIDSEEEFQTAAEQPHPNAGATEADDVAVDPDDEEWLRPDFGTFAVYERSDDGLSFVTYAIRPDAGPTLQDFVQARARELMGEISRHENATDSYSDQYSTDVLKTVAVVNAQWLEGDRAEALQNLELLLARLNSATVNNNLDAAIEAWRDGQRHLIPVNKIIGPGPGGKYLPPGKQPAAAIDSGEPDADKAVREAEAAVKEAAEAAALEEAKQAKLEETEKKRIEAEREAAEKATASEGERLADQAYRNFALVLYDNSPATPEKASALELAANQVETVVDALADPEVFARFGLEPADAAASANNLAQLGQLMHQIAERYGNELPDDVQQFLAGLERRGIPGVGDLMGLRRSRAELAVLQYRPETVMAAAGLAAEIAKRDPATFATAFARQVRALAAPTPAPDPSVAQVVRYADAKAAEAYRTLADSTYAHDHVVAARIRADFLATALEPTANSAQMMLAAPAFTGQVIAHIDAGAEILDRPVPEIAPEVSIPDGFRRADPGPDPADGSTDAGAPLPTEEPEAKEPAADARPPQLREGLLRMVKTFNRKLKLSDEPGLRGYLIYIAHEQAAAHGGGERSGASGGSENSGEGGSGQSNDGTGSQGSEGRGNERARSDRFKIDDPIPGESNADEARPRFVRTPTASTRPHVWQEMEGHPTNQVGGAFADAVADWGMSGNLGDLPADRQAVYAEVFERTETAPLRVPTQDDDGTTRQFFFNVITDVDVPADHPRADDPTYRDALVMYSWRQSARRMAQFAEAADEIGQEAAAAQMRSHQDTLEAAVRTGVTEGMDAARAVVADHQNRTLYDPAPTTDDPQAHRDHDQHREEVGAGLAQHLTFGMQQTAAPLSWMINDTTVAERVGAHAYQCLHQEVTETFDYQRMSEQARVFLRTAGELLGKDGSAGGRVRKAVGRIREYADSLAQSQTPEGPHSAGNAASVDPEQAATLGDLIDQISEMQTAVRQLSSRFDWLRPTSDVPPRNTRDSREQPRSRRPRRPA